MSLAHLASLVHKWLALLLGVQIVFWVVSGLFFTLFPIEQIRSETLIRPHPVEAPDLTRVGDLGMLHDAQGRAPTRLVIERRAIGDVVLAEFDEAAPVLFDAATLQALSPIGEAAAVEVARAHVTLASAPLNAVLVQEGSPEYRGALPAWRIDFAEGGLSVYVAQNTGAVTARRSDLWRIYDTLWALHIMDWRDHENFNHPLIIAVAALTLLSVVAGVVLIPYRFRFRKRRAAAGA